MAKITTYSTLQDNITSWLMRGADTTFQGDVPTLIQLAEASLKRDKRVRQQRVENISLSSESPGLPNDLKTIISLTLTGPTHFGPLKQVSMNEFEDLKDKYGDAAGVPTHFAIAGTSLWVHPTPGETYTGRLVYERTITNLSDANTTNWLLTNHPDIYLYASLLEAAPYLKDDERIAVWASTLEARIESLNEQRQDYYLSAQAQPSTGVVFGG